MKYEAKLLLIIKAILEAKKVTTVPSYINLYVTKVNGLSEFDPNEIWDILTKIENEEKVIKVEGYPSSLNTRLATDFDTILSNTDSYFTIRLYGEFDSWSKKYLEDEDNSEVISFDPKTVVLSIKSKTVKLKKDSFRANLIELLLKDEKSKSKEWNWDEVIEKIQGTTDNIALRENKKKFYPACDGLTKLVAQKTGINDLLIFNKSTVQINPKYISSKQVS